MVITSLINGKQKKMVSLTHTHTKKKKPKPGAFGIFM